MTASAKYSVEEGWLSLGDFIAAYIEAALWSTDDGSTPEGGKPLDQNYGVEDIAPETLAAMQTDCRRFQKENVADLVQYSGSLYTVAELGGHGFWLTRNGHGAGFWDRDDYLSEGARKRLTAASEKFGEFALEVGDDGKIHGCGC